jgi:hypothetical protein
MGGYVNFSLGSDPNLQTDSLYSLIFGNEPLRLLISGVIRQQVFPSDFPIELREYGTDSRGMDCHSDIQMYQDLETNLEVVVTLSNHGLSELYWYDREGNKKSIYPLANSITIVRPSGPIHCVSPTKGGNREILKFIMVGSYDKSRWFTEYVDNACSENNPNLIAVYKRRAKISDEL